MGDKEDFNNVVCWVSARCPESCHSLKGGAALCWWQYCVNGRTVRPEVLAHSRFFRLHLLSWYVSEAGTQCACLSLRAGNVTELFEGGAVYITDSPDPWAGF